MTSADTARHAVAHAGRFVGQLVRRGIRGAGMLATTIYDQAESWVLDGKKATYGLAVTRILLGLMMIGMFASNFSTRLYTFGAGAMWTGQWNSPTTAFSTIWPFSIVHDAVPSDAAFTALYLLLIASAVAFTLGWHTRLVQVPLFVLYVGTIELNDYIGDQSDNLVRIILMVLFFTSCAERWSLDARRRRRFAHTGGSALIRWWRFQPVLPPWFTSLFHNLGIIALACQVTFVYVSGGLFKMGGQSWMSGVAVYAPIHTQQFGPWPELSAIVSWWGPGIAIATITTLLVQVSFPLLLMRRGTRIFALIVMLGFHLAIAVLLGLPWFSLAMIAIDSIFIRDVTWVQMQGGLARAWRSTRLTARASDVPADAAPANAAPAYAVPGPLLPPRPAGDLDGGGAGGEGRSRFSSPPLTKTPDDRSLPDEKTFVLHPRTHDQSSG